MTYYPLAVGNTWTYQNADGSTFTNSVTESDGATFTMVNTTAPQPQRIRIDGASFLTDSFQTDTWQVLVSDGLAAGDVWDISYSANGIDTVLTMTVIGVGGVLEVAGTTYPGVLGLEGDMKMSMNGTPVPMVYKVQYHYADNVGLILTTGSKGESMPLISHQLF
jgi:hypothetical protein